MDYLKIDKIFIDSLTSAGADTPVLDTIAEGVTAAHQVDWLIKNQVSYVQACRDFIMADPSLQPIFISGTEKNAPDTVKPGKISRRLAVPEKDPAVGKPLCDDKPARPGPGT